MDKERSPEVYSNKELYTHVRQQCFAQLRGYSWSAELNGLIKQTQGKQETEVASTIIALAQREQGGQSYITPYLLSFSFKPSSHLPSTEQNMLDENNYYITAVRTDHLAEEFHLPPFGAAINKHNTLTGAHTIEPFNSRVVADLQHLRIPADMAEYARYDEQYRNSQAYFAALAFVNNTRPAIITTQQGSAMYELTSIDDANGISPPDISMTLFTRPNKKDKPLLPDAVALRYGSQPIAYYKQPNGAPVPIDLASVYEGTQDSALQSAYLVTTIDDLLDMMNGSMQLPTNQAATMKQGRAEKTAPHNSTFAQLIGRLLRLS